MHVLITGGAGFMGSHLARALVSCGDRVTIYDNLVTGHADNRERAAQGGAQLINGDILDAENLVRVVGESRPDAIVHMAAIVSTPHASRQPGLTARVNLEGTVNVLEAMRVHGVPRGLSISTEESYGEFHADRITEEHPQRPTSPYGITKVAAEWYSDYYYNQYGVNLVAVRTSWVYGEGYPRTRPDLHLIQDAILGRETVLAGGADQRLDFTHIDDFTRGCLLLLDAPQLKSRVYHISGDEAITLPELAELLRRYLPNIKAKIGAGRLEYSPGGMRMPQKGALDTSRARDEVGYVPRVRLVEGMRRYVEHVRELLEEEKIS